MSNLKAEFAKRDAEGVPVPLAARQLGYETWMAWGEAMNRPNAILSDLPYITLTNAAADAGRETYRYEHKP